MHLGKGIFAHVPQLRVAFASYGTYHGIAVHAAKLGTDRAEAVKANEQGQGNRSDTNEMNDMMAELVRAHKLETAMTCAWTRIMRRIIWPGTSYRTINANPKGKSRPWFHTGRCQVANGKLCSRRGRRKFSFTGLSILTLFCPCRIDRKVPRHVERVEVH